MRLPDTFADELLPVPLEIMDDVGGAALQRLHGRGIGMFIGARLLDLPEFRKLASEPAIAHNCPEDLARRFADVAKYRIWVETPGRITFQFRKLGETGLADSVLAAYTWTRPGRYTESLPCDTEYKFACRVSELFGRQGIGRDATDATISASMALDPARRKIGLKVKADNEIARRLYLRCGAEEVNRNDASLFMRFLRTYDQ